VNCGVVRDVVSIVAQGRRIEREQPDGGNPEFLQVTEPLREAHEIPDAVCIAVAESAHMKLINDGIFVPEIVLVRRQRSILLSNLTVTVRSCEAHGPHAEGIHESGERFRLVSLQRYLVSLGKSPSEAIVLKTEGGTKTPAHRTEILSISYAKCLRETLSELTGMGNKDSTGPSRGPGRSIVVWNVKRRYEIHCWDGAVEGLRNEE
jgi:hypothetical protein